MMKIGESAVSLHRPRTTLQKLVETGFLSATWLALGLYLEIYGPTLKDLKIKTNSNYEDVAVAVSGRSVGLFIGCVLGGVLVDKLGRFCHLLIAIPLDIAAIVTVIAPWSPGVAVLWVCCAIGGASETVINVAGQRLILNLWKEKSSAPMHLLHAGYGIGSFIVPLYSDPFLAVPVSTPATKTDNTTIANSSDVDYQTQATFIDNKNRSLPIENALFLKESRIEYPFAISASIVALLSVVFYCYQIKENRYHCKNTLKAHKEKRCKIFQFKSGKSDNSQSKTFRDMFNPAACTGGRLCYAIQLLVILWFYFGNANGGERLIGGFIRSFAIDHLDFASDEASYLNTSFWISFTVGRFGFFLAARWISIRKLVLIETCGISVTVVLMNILATDNKMAYWILIQSLGIFESPVWPSMMAWTDHHMQLTGVGMTLFIFAGAIGGICHLRLIGYLYENLGSETFLYQLTGYGILAFVLAIVLTAVGAQHGNRFKWQTEQDAEYRIEKDGHVMSELLGKDTVHREDSRIYTE